MMVVAVMCGTVEMIGCDGGGGGGGILCWMHGRMIGCDVGGGGGGIHLTS